MIQVSNHYYDLYSNSHLLLDRLQEDKKHGQSITLKLSTNNDHKAHPDTPEHHFKKVISSLLASSDTEDYNLTYEFATTLGANNQLDVKTLLVKYKDIILLFQDLYKFQLFKEASFEPKKLIDCKKTIWGVSQMSIYSCHY
jgi:hypothetical protein